LAAQLSFDLPVRTARGREDFFVAPCNVEAVEWIDRWPNWSSHVLAVYGPPACGKTHLAHVWRTRTGASTITSAKLDRDRLPPGLSVGVVIEHDGEPFDEVALLHVHNSIAQAGGSLLLTGETPPARWPVSLPDLRSRLRAATAVGVGRPDDELLAAVLAKLFADRQLAVAPDVIAFMMTRLERSFDAARRSVAQLDALALETGRRVSVRLASEVLSAASANDPPDMSIDADAEQDKE